MRSSYKKEDVTLLLKDITGMVKPQPTQERERLIQSGKHYCEMLPIEYEPSPAYMEAYYAALDQYAEQTAYAVGRLADKIIKQKGHSVVLISLARAGIPIGILLKRYIQKKYQIRIPHYAISIIRGRGIDHNAMKCLLANHAPKQLQFVDGWIGKGAIQKELKKELTAYPGISTEIAVLSDPANITTLCGTHEDILIPSACLNSSISGLISRTFLRSDIIGAKDFHGAIYYENLKNQDQSYEFIHTIEAAFRFQNPPEKITPQGSGLEEIKAIAQQYQTSDLNLIKPGIGETTRVLLRRVPNKILIPPSSQTNPALAHIIRLAGEKKAPIEEYPLKHYKACGIIKKLSDL